MTHHVYAKAFPCTLQECFAGTASECRTWIRRQLRAGRMTHWYFISKLSFSEALARHKKRYG